MKYKISLQRKTKNNTGWFSARTGSAEGDKVQHFSTKKQAENYGKSTAKSFNYKVQLVKSKKVKRNPYQLF